MKRTCARAPRPFTGRALALRYLHARAQDSDESWRVAPMQKERTKTVPIWLGLSTRHHGADAVCATKCELILAESGE